LSAIAIEAKENLGIETYTALVDKGYHNGKTNRNLQTSQHIHCSNSSNGEKVTKTVRPFVAQFQYNQDTDTILCPQGETLKLRAVGTRKTTDRDSYNFKKYRTPKCKECPVKHLCTQ
jgi:hypothetical protein